MSQEVMILGSFSHHMRISRLRHSINVAYISYRICRFMNWDYVSASRAGILHDLFFYQWEEENMTPMEHGQKHALIALSNAKKLTELNEIEINAIECHMWPLTKKLPRYKEAYVITLADKYCAVYEVCIQMVDKQNFFINFSTKLFFGQVLCKK